MNYPYYELGFYKGAEITIYFSEHHYVTYYDDDAEALLKDLESASDEGRRIIYNELHLDYEHNDPHCRGL